MGGRETLSDRDVSLALDEGAVVGAFTADHVTEVPKGRRPGRAARPKRPRAAAASQRFRSQGPLDARQLYMNQIQDIPVLSREAVAELSNRIREHQSEFERSL